MLPNRIDNSTPSNYLPKGCLWLMAGMVLLPVWFQKERLLAAYDWQYLTDDLFCNDDGRLSAWKLPLMLFLAAIVFYLVRYNLEAIQLAMLFTRAEVRHAYKVQRFFELVQEIKALEDNNRELINKMDPEAVNMDEFNEARAAIKLAVDKVRDDMLNANPGSAEFRVFEGIYSEMLRLGLDDRQGSSGDNGQLGQTQMDGLVNARFPNRVPDYI